MKISILQLNTIWCNKFANFADIRRLVSENLGSDMYILPEMFATGFTNDVVALGEGGYGCTPVFMSQLAKESNAVICGSFIYNEAGKYYNSFVFVNKDGVVVRYDKRHLFGYGGEREMFAAGSTGKVLNYKGFRILPQVCYDLRFPVFSSNYNDYDLAIYVANWPAGRQKAFDSLLVARAIENQAYVIGVNRVGLDGNNLLYNGGSCCIDYKGDYVWRATKNEQLVGTVEINIDAVKKFREKFPFLKDKDSLAVIKREICSLD